MRASAGHSDDPITEDAIAEVIAQVEADLGDAEPKAAILFCSVEYEHDELLAAIHARWPGLPLIGSTSDGEISSRLGFRDDSVLLTVISGDGLRVHSGVGRNLSAGIEGAVASALEGMDLTAPKLCLTTLAPSTDAQEVVRAIGRQLGDVSCPVLGGLSGDHRTFDTTSEFHGTEVFQDSIPVLFIEGDISVSWGTGSGWTATGEELIATHAEGNVVYTINDKPAISVFEDHFGPMPPTFLGEFPLSCLGSDGEWNLRACLSYKLETGELHFGGTIDQGTSVRFTEVIDKGLLKGSQDSLLHALEEFDGDDPQLALIFSCAARKWVLGSEAEKEIGLLQETAAENGADQMALSGFYCFGEIAPNHRSSPNGFHNETCVSVVLGR